MKDMLSILYTGEFTSGNGQVGKRGHLAHTAIVFALGVKYDIPAVKDRALSRYCSSTLFIRDDLKKEDFLNSIVHMYSDTYGKEYRVRYMAIFSITGPNFMQNLPEKLRKHLDSLLKSHADFKLDLLQAFLDEKQSQSNDDRRPSSRTWQDYVRSKDSHIPGR